MWSFMLLEYKFKEFWWVKNFETIEHEEISYLVSFIHRKTAVFYIKTLQNYPRVSVEWKNGNFQNCCAFFVKFLKRFEG